jgi:hypothetical protein
MIEKDPYHTTPALCNLVKILLDQEREIMSLHLFEMMESVFILDSLSLKELILHAAIDLNVDDYLIHEKKAVKKFLQDMAGFINHIKPDIAQSLEPLLLKLEKNLKEQQNLLDSYPNRPSPKAPQNRQLP